MALPPAANQSLLARWARIVVAHPWAAVAFPIVLAVLLMPAAAGFRDHLTVGGWLPPGAESITVDHRLDDEFGRHTTAHYLLFSDIDGKQSVDDNDFQREMARTLAAIRNLPGVTSIITWQTVPNQTLSASLVSPNRQSTIAIVNVDTDVRAAAEHLPQVLEITGSSALDVQVAGWPAVTSDFQHLTSNDLARAEAISLPITLVLLIVIFGGVILASLPLLATLLALVPTIAGIAILSRFIETSVFSINLVLMLGLAIGIDYALILVSRYREERALHEPAKAMTVALQHGGRTILASGAAVMTGLAGLVAIGTPAAISTSVAAVLAVLCSMITALTVVPGILLLLGNRVGPRDGSHPISRRASSLWKRWFAVVTLHPAAVLLAAIVLLLACALPAVGLQPVMPSMETIPASQPSRQSLEQIEREFPDISLSPVTVIVEPRYGVDMTSRRNLERLETFATRLGSLDGVSQVTTIFSFVPESTTSAILANGLALDADIARSARSYITSQAAVIEINLSPEISSTEREAFVQNLRTSVRSLTEGDFDLVVGGEVATGIDFMAHLKSRLPWTIGIVVSLTMLVLLAQFRSILLPLKALLLNSLALLASFGLVVAIFQHGWLPGVDATNTTVVIVPVLMFCFLFGLSMDYEVIILSRIREAWLATDDNLTAVDHGMRGSAGIVTSAATIMVIVFAAFGTSELGLIRELGVGLSLAVFLDATVIRLVALPAAMILMGRWNWWMPGGHRLVENHSPLTEERV